jgi:tRNA1Val (adenine37-N6)-methyltransferase
MSKNQNDQRPFCFRQFSLYHHQSTMKVGMDSILLGVWTQLNLKDKVLDIGTGSGIISLLLASRGAGSIIAIDIDEPSINEALINFNSSPWRSLLNAKHQRLQDFVLDHPTKFDLIISNPPFFLQGVLSASERQSNARHARSLSYTELVYSVCKLLSKSGIFSVVLPYNTAGYFVELCRKNDLYLKRKMLIFPRRGATPNRINMEFSFQRELHIQMDMLNIREENNDYTNEYVLMTKEYYLW